MLHPRIWLPLLMTISTSRANKWVAVDVQLRLPHGGGGWKGIEDAIEREYFKTLDVGVSLDRCDFATQKASDMRGRTFSSDIPVRVRNGTNLYFRDALYFKNKRSLARLFGTHTVRYDWSGELATNKGSAKLKTTLSNFLENEMYTIADNGESMYAFDSQLPHDMDIFENANPIPEFLPENIYTLGNMKWFFLIAASEAGVSFHSHGAGFNYLLGGHRKIWFINPSPSSCSKSERGETCNDHHQYARREGSKVARIGMQEYFWNIFPNLSARQQPMICIQSPGDLIYLPSNYEHATISLGETVALAGQLTVPDSNADYHEHASIERAKELQQQEDSTIEQSAQAWRLAFISFPNSQEHQVLLLKPLESETFMSWGSRRSDALQQQLRSFGEAIPLYEDGVPPIFLQDSRGTEQLLGVVWRTDKIMETYAFIYSFYHSDILLLH